MKILELFAGIGACSKALRRLGIDVEIVDAVEIDKYAMASFNAIHNTNFSVQDITTYNKNFKDIDLITHGSPCQDFSKAGKQAGGDLGSGTRSSLMYETIRIVGQVRPKYVLWENVKNILSKKHKHNFDAYIETMNVLGYNSYYQVLNAKDYGIPQNRERVYTISIRKDIDKGDFNLPEKEVLKLRLKDMLEDEVEEKYYLSDKAIQGLKRQEKLERKPNYVENKEIINTIDTKVGDGTHFSPYLRENKCIQIGKLDIKGHDCVKRVYSKDGISPTLTDMQGGNRQPKIMIKNATQQGYLEADIGDGIDISSRMKYHRGTVQKQSIQTITTAGGNERGVIIGSTQKHAAVAENGVVPTLTSAMGIGGGHIPMHNYDYKIRKLTPKECWRLMRI